MLAPQRAQRKECLVQEPQVSALEQSRKRCCPVAPAASEHKPTLYFLSIQVRRAVIALLKHIEKERAGKAALFTDADVFSLVRVPPVLLPLSGSLWRLSLTAAPFRATARLRSFR